MTSARDAHIAAARELQARAAELVSATVALHYERVPELATRYGDVGRARCLEDARYHLSYLEQAVATASPLLFARYIQWARSMLESRQIPFSDLAMNLRCLIEVLGREPRSAAVVEIVEQALLELEAPAREHSSLLGDGDPHVELAREYLRLLLALDRSRASRLILDVVEAGASIRDIYMHVFQPTQRELGRLWQLNEVSVAQEHYCTAATQLIMSQLYARLFASPKSERRMIATCVPGELHELGPRMVADLFELGGWDTVYFGANTPVPSVLAAIAEHRPHLLGISATLTVHIGRVSELIAAVRADERAAGIKIMVGGYAFNLDPGLYRQVDADLYCADAEQAVAAAGALFEAS